MAATSSPKSCVIIVENLPVPLDRRVWQEAQVLRRQGWQVSIICPMNSMFPRDFETIDDIAIYRHPSGDERHGILGYVREYSLALFHEFRLLIKVYFERGFSVIQACNPPDLIFLVVAPFKLIGKRFIFDQHDIAPELFAVKFGNKGVLYHALLLFERCSYCLADLVVVANESFRSKALTRGRKHPSLVEVVYGFPDRSYVYRVQPEFRFRQNVKFIIGYIGIIATQDGLGNLVRAVHVLVHQKEFREFRTVIVGEGPELSSIRHLASEIGIADYVVFTGFLRGDRLLAQASAFDIGVIPDPLNEANDVMSMNKVFEYCALGIPTVAYPLKETKRLLGDAAEYAPTLDAAGLAEACLRLMQDDDLRAFRAEKATRLAAHTFVWEAEADKFVQAYNRALGAKTSHMKKHVKYIEDK